MTCHTYYVLTISCARAQEPDYFGDPYPKLVTFFAECEPKGKVLDLGCGQEGTLLLPFLKNTEILELTISDGKDGAKNEHQQSN